MEQRGEGGAGTVVQTRSKQGGCLVPLLVALAVLGAVGYGLWWLRGRSVAKEERLRARWLEPWVAAVRADDLARVWPTHTTERYRAGRSLEATQRTYREAVARWGAPRSVTLVSAHGTRDVVAGRSFERVVTSWVFERAGLYVTYELVEASDGTVRVDGAHPGGYTASRVPNDAPEGPW